MSFDWRHRAEVLGAQEQAPTHRIPTFLSFAGAADAVLPPQQKDAALQLYAFADGSRLARAHTRAILNVWGWAGDHDTAVLVIAELFSNACKRDPGRPGLGPGRLGERWRAAGGLGPEPRPTARTPPSL